MAKHTIDTVLRVRTKREPGHFAKLAAAIAGEGGMIGELTTLAIGEHDSTREVTIETHDADHTARVIEAVRAVSGVVVEDVADRVFECHKGGKLRQISRAPLLNVRDLRRIYTPGVARVALEIQREPARALDLTGIGSSVGIFTNGTRVLGLGDIGPLAAMPVMEGKAVLYEQLAGINATPILVDATNPDHFVETVLRLAPGFAGIHLEDIRAPDCFAIEDRLRATLLQPVLHDDQHGTATAALAAVINATKIAGLDLKSATVGQVGLGAAGSAIARLLASYGVPKLLMADPSDAACARVAGPPIRRAKLDEIMRTSDIVIAATGRPNLISMDLVRRGQIILALSNPEPEIAPEDALFAGAALAADGRSINNALAFPGLFKGALEARAQCITPGMMIVAAETIARAAADGDLVPSPLDRGVHAAVAAAVYEKAQELGRAGTLRLRSGRTYHARAADQE